jgi:tetratricopeptide (TPR) repeat protein
MGRNLSAKMSFVLLLLAGLPVAAAAQRSTITGFVFGPEGGGVDRARVELLDDMYSVKQRQQADASGRFIFTNVPAGRYQVRAQAPGADYREQTQDVDLTSGRFDTIQLEFRLKRRREAERAKAALVVFAQDVPAEARREYDTAVSEFTKGSTAAAIGHLESAVKTFPTYFAALERLGVEQIRTSHYADAITTFTTAVGVNPRSFNCWYGLAFANFALERSVEALQAADRALEQDKNAGAVYFVIGMSQRRLKEYEKAEKAFLRAKDLDRGKTADINWNLALLYAHNLKRYAKAADELELFLKYSPGHPDTANIKKLIADFRSKQAGK